MNPKLTAIAIAAVLAILFAAPQAEAKGCIKGAIVGGVAGHYVGKGHGLLGAAGGCLVGRHYANKRKAQPMHPNNSYGGRTY